MDYTHSQDAATDAGTGNKLHSDSAPVPTVWSAEDANSIIWSLMRVVEAAGISAARFNPASAPTYSKVLDAINALIAAAIGGVPAPLVLHKWTSAEQSVPNSTSLTTVAHGQASVPRMVQAKLRCKVSEGGYAVGDEVVWNHEDNGASDRILTVYSNATNVVINYQVAAGTAAPAMRDTSGTLFSVTPSSWAVVIDALWF